MDETEINAFIRQCKHLKHKFQGVFASDNFPSLLSINTFCIVNISQSNNFSSGHWILLCHQKNDQIIFADPLGLPVNFYKPIYQRLINSYHTIFELLQGKPIQRLESNMCGLYCIYLAHWIFSPSSTLPFINDQQIKHFSMHMM